MIVQPRVVTWYEGSGITGLGSGSETLGSGSGQINMNQGSISSERLNGVTRSAWIGWGQGSKLENFWDQESEFSAKKRDHERKNVPCHDPG